LPHLSRDILTEWLCDSVDDPDSSLASALCHVGYDMMFKVAGELSKGKGSFLLEGCINPVSGGKRLLQTINTDNQDIIEIFITARDEILLERYYNRAGSKNRHEAHGEEKSRVEELRNHLKTCIYKPLNVGRHLLEIDSSEFPDKNLDLTLEFLRKVS
jgi:hypothetical protein